MSFLLSRLACYLLCHRTPVPTRWYLIHLPRLIRDYLGFSVSRSVTTHVVFLWDEDSGHALGVVMTLARNSGLMRRQRTHTSTIFFGAVFITLLYVGYSESCRGRTGTPSYICISRPFYRREGHLFVCLFRYRTRLPRTHAGEAAQCPTRAVLRPA